MNIKEHKLWKYCRLATMLFLLVAYAGSINAQDCCDQGDKPNSLTVVYTGEGCSATNTTQDATKYSCSDVGNGPNSAPSVYVKVAEKEDGSGKIFFMGLVSLGSSFTPTSSNGGSNEFTSNTWFLVYDSQGGALLQKVKVHTSCSAPIIAGEQFGSMFLLSATFKNGINCGPATPPSPPEECPIPEITINSSQGTNNTTVCEDEAILFVTDAPDCDSVTLTWNFGVGANPPTATGKGPHYVTYSSSGTATVTLTADNDCEGGVGTTVCPPPPPPPIGSNCCDAIGGKPKMITVKYTGANCSETNTSQQTDKYDCDNFNGGPNSDPNVYITVTENSDGSGKNYFSGNVAINTTFTPNAGNVGDNEFKSKVFFNIYSSQGGTLLQRVNMHTSCSAPLVPGENIGSILLESTEWKDGSFCDVSGGGSGSGSGGADCCDSNSGKPKKLVLEYTGEGCSATNTSQQTDKYDCDNYNGGPNGAPNVYITVTENSDGSGKNYFSGNVAINTTFTPNAGNVGDNEFKSKVFIRVFSSQGGTLRQVINMHTSCSAPLVPGDQIGSAKLISAEWSNGNSCGPYNPPGPNCLDCEETVSITITIIDCICINEGGDSDGDGVCNNQDCAPFDPNFPKPAGTACDDGNPNTVNDVIQADGCTCAGTPVQVCDNVTLGGTIGFGNICAASATVCNSAAPQIINCVSPSGGSGNFETIWLKAINNPNCYPPTTTVDNIDQDPFWSIIPGETGLTLNPGVVTQQTCYLRCTRRVGCTTYIESNIITVNIQPGCGTGPPDCNNISITQSNGTITIGNLDAAPFSSVKIFNSSWGTEYSCYANCPSPSVSVNVGAGTYYVYAGYVAANYQLICEANATIVVGGGGPCANQGGDSDGDGVCDNQDCQPNNPAFPATPGSPCNDGNPNTINDVVTANGCGCAGTVVSCNLSAIISVVDGCLTDSYLIFADANDPYFPPNNPNYLYSYNVQPASTIASGTTIDPRSITLTFNAPGTKTVTATVTDPAVQNCQIVLQTSFTVTDCSNPCANNGGDSDGDGVCNNQDCAPFNANLPTTPGIACNDGNANTYNDVIQADGCTCAGTPAGGDPDCENDITITTGIGTITVTGLDGAPVSSLQIFTSDWTQTIINCFGNCDATTTVNVNEGDYIVYAKYYSASYTLICEKHATVTVGGGDPCTNNGGDSDGDGVCDNQDCSPFNSNLPTTPGSTCDDGNPNTVSDVIQPDGCSCAGMPLNGDECDTKSNGCVTVLLNDITSNSNGSYTYEFNVTHNCSQDLSYAAFELPDGVVAQGIVTNGWNANYTYENPTNNPFYSIKFETSGSNGISNGEMETFTFTLPSGTEILSEIRVQVKSSTNTYLVSLSTANCNGGGGNNGGTNGDCNNINISTGAGTIIVSGLDGAPVSSVQVFSIDWTQVYYTCFGDCNATENISMPADSYIVLAKYYNASWQPQCDVMQTVSVTSNLRANDHFDFTAAKQPEHTELYWVHNNGDQVADYVLERSADGTDFETIYQAPSKGTARTEVYQAFDLSPVMGDNHYRIKVNLLDGSIQYSQIKTVHFTDLVDFVLFPNPSNDFVKANLETIVEKEDVTITIFNNLGVEIQRFHLDEVYSKYYQMDIRELKEGYYIVWLEIPGHKPTAQKLVVGKI